VVRGFTSLRDSSELHFPVMSGTCFPVNLLVMDPYGILQSCIAEIFGRYAISFGDAERGTSIYKVFLNALVATSWNTFAGDIFVKSRDAIKLHQEK